MIARGALELDSVFEQHQPLVRELTRDLTKQRVRESGLARVGAAGDHDAPRFGDGASQLLALGGRYHRVRDVIVERIDDRWRLANREAWARRYRRHEALQATPAEYRLRQLGLEPWV